jgi:predicted phosphoribosyltransferase
MFTDRKEAGKLLAQRLESYRGKEAVVYALPRGGVVTGYEIASALALPLDIIAVRKIGSPDNPEYAIGAVAEEGAILMNESEAQAVDQTWLKEETEREHQEAMRRSSLYRGDREPMSVTGKTAIIVDDGIATGFTMRLAVRFVKSQKPRRIIVAVPVAPEDSVQALYGEGADEVIALESLDEFAGAVGAHYQTFDQVEDNEVITLLQSVHREM